MSHHGEFCQFTEDVQLCPLSSSPDHHGSLSAYIAVWCPFRWQTRRGSGSPEGWKQHSYIRDGMAMGIIIIIMQKVQERSRKYIMSMCSWNDVLDNLVSGWLRDHPGAGHKNPTVCAPTLLYQQFTLNKKPGNPNNTFSSLDCNLYVSLHPMHSYGHYISQGLQITQNLE